LFVERGTREARPRDPRDGAGFVNITTPVDHAKVTTFYRHPPEGHRRGRALTRYGRVLM